MADGVIDSLSINITSNSTSANSAINTLITGLEKLEKCLSGFTTTAGNFTKATDNVTGSVNRLNANVQRMDVSNLEKASGAMKKLGESSKSLNGQMIGNVSKVLESGLFDFKSKISSVGSTFKSIGSGSTSVISALGKFSKGLLFSGRAADDTGRRYSTLASKIGLLYVKFFLIIRVFRLLKGMIDTASQLTEVQNVVDVTFGNMSGKLDKFSKTAIKSFGLSELSAKQFASRFQAMGNAMGITGQQVQTAQQKINQFKLPDGTVAGYNKMSNSMADMSINLTKLTADMASFYDVSQEDVAKALQSGVMAGMTRPLRQYGLDLTEATLKEWAMKNGLDANIKSMTQAQKAMLRYQYVMANATAAQGDFQRTSKTWHNQVVILKQQLQQLAAIIGSGLIQAIKPFVIAVNQALSGIIAFAQKVVNALGKIFGWQMEMSTSGITMDDSDYDSNALEDIASGADDASDSFDNAAKSAKKFKDQLQGFDKLNVLRTMKDDAFKSPSTNNNPNSGNGTNLNPAGANDGQIKSALKKTKGLFESEIDNLYELGKYIGDTLTKALASINWPKVYEGARNFGKGLADFLNGLISPGLFSALGKTIAGCINTALHFLDSFGQTFDWRNFGKSLGVGLTTFLNTLDWNTALSGAANWGKGLATTLNNFLANTSFEAIGRTIAGLINTAVTYALSYGTTFNFSLLGKKLGQAINSTLYNVNWGDIKSAAHEWASGLARTINSFVRETDFSMVGITVANLLGTAISAAFDLGNTLDFKKLGQKLAEAVNGFIKTFPAEKFADTIDAWVQGIYDLAVEFFAKLDWDGLKAKIKEFFGHLDWKTLEIILSAVFLKKGVGFAISIGGAILSAIAGEFTKKLATTLVGKMAGSTVLSGAIGKGLGDAATKASKGEFLGTAGVSLGKSLFGTFMVGGGTYIAVKSFLEMWDNGWHIAGEVFKDVGIAIAAGGAVMLGLFTGPFALAIGGAAAAVSTLAIVVHDHWDDIKKSIGENVGELKKSWEQMKKDAGSVGSDLKKAWDGLAEDASKGWEGLQKKVGGYMDSIKENISTKWDETKSWWDNNSTLSAIKSKVEDFSAGVKKKWDGVKTYWKGKSPLEKIKTTYEDIKGKVKGKWSEAKTYWKGKNPLEQVKTTYESIRDKIKEKWNDTKSYWKGKNPLEQVKTTYENFKEKVSGAWGKAVSFWKGKSKLEKVKFTLENLRDLVQDAWKSAKNWISGHLDLGKMKLGLSYPSIRIDVNYKHIGSLSIPYPSVSFKWRHFASGGFLDQFKSFTMATIGENGVPEILGQVGGRPAVAGGQEITGIRNSIEQTGYEQIELLRRQNQILTQILNKEFGISKDDIFSAVRDKNSDYMHRTGRSAFAT